VRADEGAAREPFLPYLGSPGGVDLLLLMTRFTDSEKGAAGADDLWMGRLGAPAGRNLELLVHTTNFKISKSTFCD
jgi:hypothetical protein